MGLFTKIAKADYVKGPGYELGKHISSTGSSVSNIFGTGGDRIDVLKEYSGYVWKCVNARAESIAKEDIFVERLVANKWQKDDAHEFNKVLEGEDGNNDQYELLEAHSKSLDFYGESFWYVSKGERYDKPTALYLLDPSAVTVFVQDGRIHHYQYNKDTINVIFDLDEIIYFRISDPRQEFRGMGPMQAAGWFIRSSRYVTTYINNFLENNAIPAGVVVAKDQVDDTDWALFKEQWTAKYSGIDNMGKTAFVRGDLDFVKTGLSLGEVDFTAIKDSSRDDILAMFSVPKPIIGIFEDINKASATTARQLFAITVPEPALRRIQSKLNRKLRNWYGPQYRIGFTNPVPDDREQKIVEYDKGVGRWITVNEARAAFGHEPLGAEFDTITIESRSGRAGSSDTKALQAPKKTLGTIKLTTKTNHKASFDYQMKESYRSETEDIQIKFEQQFFQKSNSFMTGQKERVLNQIGTKKQLIGGSLDVQAESDALAAETLPLFIGLALEQGDLAAAFAGGEGAKFTLTEEISRYIEASVKKAMFGFTDETQILVAKAIEEALIAEESISKIRKRIEKIYDDVLGVKTPGYRIERLGRTEIVKASNEITEAAYRQTNVIKKKEWFTNPGACEFCKALNGSIIQIGGTFVPKGSTIEGVNGGTRVNDYEDVRHSPVHPSCRCTIIPVIEEQIL